MFWYYHICLVTLGDLSRNFRSTISRRTIFFFKNDFTIGQYLINVLLFPAVFTRDWNHRNIWSRYKKKNVNVNRLQVNTTIMEINYWTNGKIWAKVAFPRYINFKKFQTFLISDTRRVRKYQRPKFCVVRIF